MDGRQKLFKALNSMHGFVENGQRCGRVGVLSLSLSLSGCTYITLGNCQWVQIGRVGGVIIREVWPHNCGTGGRSHGGREWKHNRGAFSQHQYADDLMIPLVGAGPRRQNTIPLPKIYLTQERIKCAKGG